MEALESYNRSGEVILRCGHAIFFYPRPRVNDIVFCQSCDNYSQYKGEVVGNKEFRLVVCMECKYRRRLKHKEHFRHAPTLATTHSMRKKHDVEIFNERGKMDTVSYTPSDLGKLRTEQAG
jgi:hypothetical protein